MEYEVPYCDYLPKDPSMEEVHAVVVEQAVRPELDCFSKDIKVCVVNESSHSKGLLDRLCECFCTQF